MNKYIIWLLLAVQTCYLYGDEPAPVNTHSDETPTDVHIVFYINYNDDIEQSFTAIQKDNKISLKNSLKNWLRENTGLQALLYSYKTWVILGGIIVYFLYKKYGYKKFLKMFLKEG